MTAGRSAGKGADSGSITLNPRDFLSLPPDAPMLNMARSPRSGGDPVVPRSAGFSAGGRPRTGSVWRRHDGRWVAAITTDQGRRVFYGRTREAALAKASARQDVSGAGTGRRSERAGQVRKIIETVLARRDEWAGSCSLVDVLAAQLTTAHIRYGIVGPCAYCGSWLAEEVDHVVPVCADGSSEPSNLVSACARCNRAKGKRQGRP